MVCSGNMWVSQQKKMCFTVKSHIYKATQYEWIPVFLLLDFCLMTRRVHFLSLRLFTLCNFIASRLDSQCTFTFTNIPVSPGLVRAHETLKFALGKSQAGQISTNTSCQLSNTIIWVCFATIGPSSSH